MGCDTLRDYCWPAIHRAPAHCCIAGTSAMWLPEPGLPVWPPGGAGKGVELVGVGPRASEQGCARATVPYRPATALIGPRNVPTGSRGNKAGKYIVKAT